MWLQDVWRRSTRRWKGRLRRGRMMRHADREEARTRPVAKGFAKRASSRWLLAGAITATVAYVALAWLTVTLKDDEQHWLTWSDVVRILNTLFAPLVFAGVTYLVFISFRRHWVVRDFVRRARQDPAQVVPMAGTVVGEVIGRDELCQVLMDNLRDRETARPNVIVGGPGAGKTAVLLRLTQLLAERGVVPVAIRMRDMNTETFDFEAEAQGRFTAQVNDRLLSQGEADRIWRHLRRDNRVVVLADGLEEVLNSTGTDVTAPGAADDRTGQVQLALDKAAREELQLVVASRYEDPIRVMEVTVTELEPLGERPALDFLAGSGKERGRYAHVIQCADVAASPLYLQLIHDLDRRDRLHRLIRGEEWLKHLTDAPVFAGHLDRHLDRTRMRLAVLDDWHRALLDGKLYEDYGLNQPQRRRTSDVLAALACVGLSIDTAQVTYLDLASGPAPDAAACPPDGDGSRRADVVEDVRGELKRRYLGTEHAPDTELLGLCVEAAIMGSELGIVENHKGAVRFRHNIFQAYLGSRFLPWALGKRNDAYISFALAKGGRELLSALVMHSRRGADATASIEDLRNRLVASAEEQRRPPVKALEIYAAALEIDRITSRPEHPTIVRKLAEDWPKGTVPSGQQWLALVEAKVSLAQSMGKSAQWIANRADLTSKGSLDRLAYGDMFDIAVKEDEQAVKLALVHEIGQRGGIALSAIGDRLSHWWQRWDDWWIRTTREHSAKPAVSPVLDPTASRSIGSSQPGDAEDSASTVRELWRVGVVCAWLAPLLYSTVEDDHAGPLDSDDAETRGGAGLRSGDDHATSEDAASNLKRWITGYLGRIDPSHPEKRPWISLEIALAQGFKHAANRRPADFERYERRRNMLIEQAELALKHSRFWFAQLSLIQALALLSMPKDPNTPLQDRGHGSDPRALVGYWLAIAGTGFSEVEHRIGHRNHPFVREAARLAELALLSRRPEQFLWIDEQDTVRRVGSVAPLSRKGALKRRAAPSDRPREHRLWLLPSVGWAALNPRARELLGDVLVMLNLAERGAGTDPEERESRLSRADRSDLPPCVTNDRTTMNVHYTINSVGASEPGSTCHDRCLFRLCPYPPAGEPSYRAELPEGFCRKLAQTNERGDYERQLTKAEHRLFWMGMMRRIQPRVKYGGLPSAARLD